MKKTFRGGVHVKDGKSITAALPIQRIFPKGDAVYPLQQHIGRPAVATVKKGDTVLVGQCIASPADGLSAGICSGVSGTVKGIEERMTVSGYAVPSIIIENDGAYTRAPELGQKRDFHDLRNDEIRAIARAAGVVGLGGAGFPTDIKLTPKEDNAIEYVIINGAECEPYLTSDYRLMMERAEELLEGLRILLHMFPNAKGIIAIEDNKKDAIRLLTHLTATHPQVSVCTLKTKYPQGGERSLVYAVTGRKPSARVLPYQVGCIVHNVATVIALYQAVSESTPLVSRVVTLSGDAFQTPGNYEIPIGCSLQESIDLAGGFSTAPTRLIAGGPMMGTGLVSLDVPVQKTTSSVLAFADTEKTLETTACIHCGRCVKVCPANLVPQLLNRVVDRGDMDAFQKHGGMECVSCGSCSYICPARIRLTQKFVQGKTTVAENRKKEKEGAK